MSTRQPNGVHPVNRLREEMDQLFDNLAGWSPFGAVLRTYPPLNIWEDDQNLYAEAEVPGLTMNDIEVYVVGNELTSKGERKGADQDGYHRRERGTGSFLRTIPLPVVIDSERVEANLHNGVLNITLPKSEAARPRKIEVKSV
jgi:HSP20 family protein